MPRCSCRAGLRRSLRSETTTTTSLADITSSALDLRWNLNPVEATAEGLKDYDGRYGSYTREDVGAHIAALRSVSGTLEAVEAEDLDAEIDRTALLGEVRVATNRLKVEQPHERDPGFWLTHALEGLYLLLVRQDRTAEERKTAVRSRLEDLPRFLGEGRETLNACPRVFVETALQISDAATGVIRNVAETLGSPGDADFEKTVSDALSAVEDFVAFIGGDLLDNAGDGNYAIGEDAFNFRLHFEHALRSTAPEIYRYGLRLVEEVESEIAAIAREMDFQGPWPDLVAKLRADHPSAQELVSAYREEMNRSFEFVVEQGLVAIPEGGLDVVETPPFLRPMAPIAGYQGPGVFSEDRTGTFMVSVPGDGIDPKLQTQMLRNHCFYDLPTIALHEGYPGHHLQILTAQEQPSPIRKTVSTPLMIEGWALYCEDMMAEEGFYRSLEERLFQKVQLLWRAVRVVLDVGLHTRGMSFGEAIDMLVDRVGIERTNAEAEVRRYCANPGYQLCYAVGRREIKALRASYQAAAGADFSLQEFHSTLLSYGSLPVSLARWGMGVDD